MYCNKCGAENSSGAKFCRKCGEPTSKIASEYPVFNKENSYAVTNYRAALAENEEFGSFAYRFLAYAIDYTLMMLIAIVLAVALIVSSWDVSESTGFYFIVFMCYHIISLSIWSSTPGKMLMGLRVACFGTGEKITITQAIGRSLGYILSSLLLAVGFWIIIFNKTDKQTWHDSIAGTVVIRDKKKELVVGVILSVVSILFLVYLAYLGGENATDYSYTSSYEEQATTEDYDESIIAQADYDEGHKAGYADGRSTSGEWMDNYVPPATTSREDYYVRGYAEGFLLGCEEGDFDCSEIQDSYNKLMNDSYINTSDLYINTN